jgi:hypothetical protein
VWQKINNTYKKLWSKKMKAKTKIIVSIIIGLASGLAAWCAVETSLHFNNQFKSIIAADIIFGMIAGGIFGIFIGTTGGIISKSGKNFFNGILWGLCFGIFGGALGLVLGRILVFNLGNYFFEINTSFSSALIIFVKAFGWAIVGGFIGLSQGMIYKSFQKIRNGLIGGLVGGFSGGILYEIIFITSNKDNVSRLAGLVLIGILIALALVLYEKILTKAVLKLLNGKQKGHEYELSTTRVKIGKSEKADIGLFGFKKVAARHGEIKKDNKSYFIKNGESSDGIKVNDNSVENYELKSGDIIEIGDAKLVFVLKTAR